MPTDPDAYLVARSGRQVELKIKGSRFLGQVFAVESLDAAQAALGGVKKRYHDATHHCWARRLGDPATAEERFDDDGEPSGTAGPPILAALQRENLGGVLVVITRYYGGTKLGTGGLARAYGDAAREALTAAPRETRWRTRVLRISCAFDDVGTVESVLAKSGETILTVEREFDPEPVFHLTAKIGRADALRRTLIEATAGRIQIHETD